MKDTIGSLTGGTKVPDEILICIPKDYAERARVFESAIVKVIATEMKGQVRQRAFGFTQCRFPLVMQLDDDILLASDAVAEMSRYLFALGTGNAIGPVYYGKTTGTCIYGNQVGFLKNLFDSMICMAPWGKSKMGKYTRIGINYGVDDSLTRQELEPVQWLPGGCVLSFKEDLVTDDFFPFDGKAYCEDVYHSFYRSRAGIKMWVATKIRAVIDVPPPEFGGNAVKKVIAIRRRFVEMIHGPLWRLSIYEAFCRIRSRIYG